MTIDSDSIERLIDETFTLIARLAIYLLTLEACPQHTQGRRFRHMNERCERFSRKSYIN